MVGTEGKTVTLWRSSSLENAFPQQFHDNKSLWDSLALHYFGYEVILFQIFFKYQHPENILPYVTNPEFRINPEIFHPWCSDPAETSFYPKTFSQMDESIDVNENSSAGKKDDTGFDEDKKDHYNLAEIAEEHEKTEEKEKQTKSEK